MTGKRVILLGLDGATYDLFGRWAADGIMPNLSALMEKGAWGELQSTVPPTTPTAWSACLTGKNPGKHNIYDFRQSPLVDSHRPLISSHTIRGRKLWDLLADHDKRTGFLNVPITYPPVPVNGFMISGLMTPGEDVEFTYPADLKQELLTRFPGYRVNLDIAQYDVAYEDDALAFLDDVSESFTQRSLAMFWLMENQDWDFFMPVFILPDRIQHLFWKYLDPNHAEYDSPKGQRLREPLLACYRLLDQMLGQLMERLPSDTSLLIMSDHGFGGTQAWINVNLWLQQHGLLNVTPGHGWRKRLFYELMQLETSSLVHQLLPERIRAAARRKIRRGRSTFKTDVETTIDFATTKAFFASVPCQGIYINVKRGDEGVVEPGDEYETLRATIRDDLLKLRDPATGMPVVDHVWYREEVYYGDYVKNAPDILFVARDYAYLGRQLFGSRSVVETSQHMGNGFHRMNGMFLAYGPNIKAGHQLDGCDITDIAPTVMHAMGLRVPDDMDGYVIEDVWTTMYRKVHPVDYVTAKSDDADLEEIDYSDSDRSMVEARLAALGYLD